MSEPAFRDIQTINLKPRLASHAPNVKITIDINGVNISADLTITHTIIIDDNIIASKQKSDRRKCVVWINKVNVASINATISKNVIFIIGLRKIFTFWFTRSMLYRAFNPQQTKNVDLWRPRSLFYINY